MSRFWQIYLIYLSTYLPLHPSIYLLLYLSPYPPIYLAKLAICLSTSLFTSARHAAVLKNACMQKENHNNAHNNTHNTHNTLWCVKTETMHLLCSRAFYLHSSTGCRDYGDSSIQHLCIISFASFIGFPQQLFGCVVLLCFASVLWQCFGLFVSA